MKKRQLAATHVLAILVSEEHRNKKPYSKPVQFVPYYKSIYSRYHCKSQDRNGQNVFNTTSLGRFLSSVPCGSWNNDRKMTPPPLPLCRGCEGQGLMDNRTFAASHSHLPSVPCDFCSPALKRATLHLSSLSRLSNRWRFNSDDTRGDTRITYSNHDWPIVESTEGQSVVSTRQMIMYVIGDKNLGGILSPP